LAWKYQPPNGNKHPTKPSRSKVPSSSFLLKSKNKKQKKRTIKSKKVPLVTDHQQKSKVAGRIPRRGRSIKTPLRWSAHEI
jgi:hypothetical protein